MKGMKSETPLSDLIPVPPRTPTGNDYAAFLELFCRSQVGVMAVGAPEGTGGTVVSTDENPLALGLTDHVGGRRMVLAFADPIAFARVFGLRFNAEMRGLDVLRTALHNPDCQGVLVNSARAEASIVIERETAASLVAEREARVGSARRPWWKVW